MFTYETVIFDQKRGVHHFGQHRNPNFSVMAAFELLVKDYTKDESVINAIDIDVIIAEFMITTPEDKFLEHCYGFEKITQDKTAASKLWILVRRDRSNPNNFLTAVGFIRPTV